MFRGCFLILGSLLSPAAREEYLCICPVLQIRQLRVLSVFCSFEYNALLACILRAYILRRVHFIKRTRK